MAYGIAVKFGANSGLTIDGAEDDLEFETRLYTLDGSVGITDSPFEAAYWIYDVAWSNPNGTSEIETYLEFDDPIDLETWEIGVGGNYYFAAVMSEYESATELTVQGQANSDSDNSTGTFSQAGDGSFVVHQPNLHAFGSSHLKRARSGGALGSQPRRPLRAEHAQPRSGRDHDSFRTRPEPQRDHGGP